MPRQDVPYGGAICRLKERIAEIWDELGKKLHSINGVEGDAAGDVKIVSGDAAIVVTSDQVNHQIEVALDSSQLPAASVSSVNGQTGAVALDAGDIPSDGNSDVQTDIDVNKAAISACSSAITSEQLARQNADSTLQTNINTALATIPGEVTTQIASNATIQQLVYADQNENIKISDVNQYAVGLTGNQGPIAGEKQFLSTYKFIKRIMTTASATPGWRKLWTFSGRCSIKILTMSIAGQQRGVGSTEYLIEFRSAQFDSNQNRQTIICRSVAADNIVIGATYNQQSGEEVYCIYGRIAVSSHEVFLIEESFLESMQFKTNFVESNDNTSYSLTDIGTIVTIGGSL